MKEDKNLKGECREFTLIIQAELDNVSTTEEKEALRTHLDHCENCRRLFNELSVIKQASAGLTANPPYDLYGKILNAIEEERISGNEEKYSRKKRVRMVSGLGGLAAVAVLCLVIYGAAGSGFMPFFSKADTADAKAYITAEGSFGDNATQEQSVLSQAEYEESSGPVDGMPESIASDSNYIGRQFITALPEDLYEKADEIIAAYGLDATYEGVYIVKAKKLPMITANYDGIYSNVGVYEMNEYSDFIINNSIEVSVSIEFTDEEIEDAGLRVGGYKKLLIIIADS